MITTHTRRICAALSALLLCTAVLTPAASTVSAAAQPSKHEAYPAAVNQLGYLPHTAKKAVVHMEAVSKSFGYDYALAEASTGEIVYTNTLVIPGADSEVSSMKDRACGEYTFTADFSDFQTPGEYYLLLSDWQGNFMDSPASVKFRISEDVYDGVLTNAFNYFYLSRSAEDLSADFITSGDRTKLAHAAGHNPDKAYIQSGWVQQYAGTDDAIETENGTADVTGGWYGSQSYEKYVIDGAAAVWLLQNMYETARVQKTDLAAYEKAFTVPGAESGLPAVLRETKTELEMLRALMVESDDIAFRTEAESDTNHYKGMVYHSVRDTQAEDVRYGISPEKYAGETGSGRIVTPPTTAATLNAAAVLAQGSRLFAPYDAAYAEAILADAVTCFNAAKANPELYAPYDRNLNNNRPADCDVYDEFYWAASELFITTHQPSYLAEMNIAKQESAFQVFPYKAGWESYTYTWVFDRNSTSACGTMSLALHTDLLNEETVNVLTESFTDTAKTYLEVIGSNGFGVPYNGADYSNAVEFFSPQNGGYELCSNGYILGNSIILAYAAMLTGEDAYRDAAVSGLDYVFGKNPMDTSYVTGCGTFAPANVSHIYWANSLDESFPAAPDGVLVSGASIYTSGFEKTPSAKCYADDITASDVNRSDLGLNAALAWMVSYMQFVDTKPEVPEPTGDVNGDRQLDGADAVALQQFLLGQLWLPNSSFYAGDLNQDRTLNAVDLTLLKQMILQAKAAEK